MIELQHISLAQLRQQAATVGFSSEVLAALSQDARRGARQLAAQVQSRARAQAQEQLRLLQLLHYERPLWQAGQAFVAGIDEVGVGPLAGPVVAAAVILPPSTSIGAIDDSKRLSAKTRLRLDGEIRQVATAWSIGLCSVAEIDAGHIFRATREAARRAVVALSTTPQHLLVDAYRVPRVGMPQTAIIQGDSLSQSIAAASIVAKVARDAIMRQLDVTYPQYGFVRHVGYGTAEHLAALRRYGPCPEHRRSFSPVRDALKNGP